MQRTLSLGLLWLLALSLSAQEDFDRLTFHQAPKPLAPDAVTADWPRFLGPNDDGSTSETHLLTKLSGDSLVKVWEVERGGGYTCPAIVGDRLVHFHSIRDVDIVECLHPETGKRYWEFTYDNPYRDRYGFSNGPRASPVIADGRVYTLSATSKLHCLDLESGKVLWKRDLLEEYEIGDFFFGHGPTPLVYQDQVIVPMGGKKGVAVAAFHRKTGVVIWEAPHASWRASYASPVMGTFHGKDVLLSFMGGSSRPSVGGLLCIDPQTGDVHSEYAWRAEKYESVNAATPVILPGNRILISETYELGASMLEVTADFQLKPLWTAESFKLHWATPYHKDGYFYAFTGRNEPDANLDCWDAASGELKWRESFLWPKDFNGQQVTWGFFRGSTLVADGRVYALGELGTLAILELTPESGRVVDQVDLFGAQEAWTLPALSRGLLYVAQNRREMAGNQGPRLICYDLRRDSQETK